MSAATPAATTTPASAAATVAAPATSKVSGNIKYVIVGIDNQTGSINYIKEDSDTIVDSANKDTTPYSIFNEQSNSDSITYVKFKVKKSSTQPIQNSNNQTPYFELNKSWYTLLLDQHVTPRETTGIVTSDWFGNAGLEQDPFSIFKGRFYNTELVLKNLKYLFNLSKEDCNFNTVFPEIDRSKDGSFEEIVDALKRPFFAIKTFLDMESSREATNRLGQEVTVYFTSGRKRYGYPNINGDKSAIISGLQMLYDVRNRCPDCVNTDGNDTLVKLLTHIFAQHYFLKKDENEDSIGDFDRDVDSLVSPKFDAKTFNILDFLRVHTSATAVTPGKPPPSIEILGPFTEGTALPDFAALTKNLVIIESDKPLPKSIDGKGYKLIGEISELRELDQFVYTNFEEKLIYNDVEIRLLDGSKFQYLAKPKKISLYRKLGSTFRELLEGSKYGISKYDIERTLRLNPLLKFIDNFLSDNIFENNENIENFMRQYLSDQSKIDLETVVDTRFTGLTHRHGICNYSGTLSYFTAAMQLVYDCCLFKSEIVYSQNIFSDGNKVSADVRMAELELKNIEYCLERVFENIQTNLKQRENYKDPTQIFTTEIRNKEQNVPAENYFYNYKICADFIVKAKNVYSKLMVPKKGNNGLNLSEFRIENLNNNYFYRTHVFNILELKTDDLIKIEEVKDDPTIIAALIENVLSETWNQASKLSYLVALAVPFIYTPLGYTVAGTSAAALAYLNSKRREAIFQNLKNENIQKQLLGELQAKLEHPDITTNNLPFILSNDCVKIIHQLILVLFKKFNVFIDFEDDLRKQPKKIAEFKNELGTIQIPNFVIKIGSLPREVLADETLPAATAGTTAGATAPVAPEKRNCIKITGFPDDKANAEYANGVYNPYKLPDGTEVYKHDDRKQIYLAVNSTSSRWEIYFADADPGTRTQVIATSTSPDIIGEYEWDLKETFYSDANVGVERLPNIKSEYIGAQYVPQPGEPVTITPVLKPLADTYTLDTPAAKTEYDTIGTIYKSIHHDFIYKYYNHEYKILFSDCRADYKVEEPKLNTMTAGMFPFIRLYRKRTYSYPADLTDVIYSDAINWARQPKP